MASVSRLKPGEKGRIQVTVDPAGKRGLVTKTAQVYSNDPKQPVVTLQVTMQVRDAGHLGKDAAAGIFDQNGGPLNGVKIDSRVRSIQNP